MTIEGTLYKNNYTNVSHICYTSITNIFGADNMKELTITKNDAGVRLDRFVSKAVPLLPDALLQKYIRIKRIKINGKGAKRDTRLNEGDILQLYINDEFFAAPEKENAYLKIVTPKLNVVYEDDNILLLDKKPGVLCHSAQGETEDTLINNVKAYLYQSRQWRPREENTFSPALCNRIDRNTGGLVIAAKNAETLRIINEKIKSREIGKYYLCATLGVPSPERGILHDYISKDESENKVSLREESFDGAKEAITRYRTLQKRGDLALVECQIITGRTHQIRAQMANLGAPILGDMKYGNGEGNRGYRQKGQALYSYKISFDFESDAGALNYLNRQEFHLTDIPFVEKFFDSFHLN